MATSREVFQSFQIAASGMIQDTQDIPTQIGAHLWALVSTRMTERVMMPTYGTSAWSHVFDDIALTEAVLTDEIRTAVARYEPRARIVSVVPFGDVETAVAGVVVNYTVVGVEDQTIHTVQVPGLVRSLENRVITNG